MAIIYDAVLNPTKQEFLSAWLPKQSWFPLEADAADLAYLGAYPLMTPPAPSAWNPTCSGSTAASSTSR
ncbi:hypothetical protein [Arthrobacter sp. Marseille-P9274]|uniref:hypothetical protein n=1 Tax=Arthrobacter sp. Marseille-P9274 TaxID=2866572 RepID=UPI0021C833E0|nr:hypothetical protein [Arthrobacter sp. Marseille-P9274]